MTKVTIIGSKDSEIQPKRKIEFEHLFMHDSSVIKNSIPPSGWKNIELICFDYRGSQKDLMYAYDDNRHYGALYLGKFNDGIV